MTIFNRSVSRRTAIAMGAGVLGYVLLGGSKCATIANLAIRNGRVWTGDGNPPIEGGTVALRDQTIIAVGADDDVELGRDTRIIDVHGAFVMPGIIDTHVHVTETLVSGQSPMPGWVRAGVTTVRDTGTIWQGPDLLRSLAAGLPVAPRVIATGGILTVADGYPTSRGPIGVAASKIVEGVDGAAEAVNQTLDAGAEFIKIAVENGQPGGTLHLDAGYPTLSLAQVQAIVAAAHARGAHVTAHVTNEWELRVALDGGVDSLAHTPIDPIPNDLLDHISSNRIPITATANIWGGGELARNVQRNIKHVLDGGGIVAMGTDFPYQERVGLPLDELRLMRAAGLTNEQVLLSATRDAAVVCARDDLGVLVEGRLADLLVVDGDPLEDLDDLVNRRLVLQNGVEVV
jgi:imidazolonepropionase-like amidohydrolase